MLSILIPTFNHLTTTLVKELHLQCSKNKIIFEILICDDASTNKKVLLKNSTLNKLSNVYYIRNKTNIGRSATRNKLAVTSKYKWLLFIDADVIPKSKKFIKNYLNAIDNSSQVLSGGITYRNKPIEKKQILRWKYGKNREYKPIKFRQKNPYVSLFSSNFLILKKVIVNTPFNEEISKKTNEDSLFSYVLKLNKIMVKHIENEVFHENLEYSSVFLKKTLEYSKSSLLLVQKNLLNKDYMKITKAYFTLKKFKIDYLFKLIYIIFERILQKQLKSSRPSLFIFDLYRLSYLCYISKI